MKSPQYSHPTRSTTLLRITILSGLIGVAGAVHAADRIKANNANNLTDPASWSGGVVPTSADVGVWDGTVLGANTVALGASTNWAGIRIANPGGTVTVTPGNALTIGASGIDASAATQDLLLSNNVVLGALENWSIAAGRTVRLGGNFTRVSGSALRINFADGTSSLFVTNGIDAAMLGNATNSTFGNTSFGTINDTDFAATIAVSGLQVVGGSTFVGLYTPNIAGANPTIDINFVQCMDFVNTGSYGARTSGSRTYSAVRFNVQQTYVGANAIAFGGVPAWQINHTAGRNITYNAWLVTSNVGPSAVFDNGGGGFIIGGGGTSDCLVFQNNPGAPLFFQNVISGAGGSINKMGIGTLEMSGINTYTGGTRLYEGVLRIAGNGRVGTGALSIFGGRFEGNSGSLIAPSSTTTSSGATNRVNINAANGQFIITNTVTYNAGSTYLEFNYANGITPSTTNAPLLVMGAVTNNGTLNISMISGILPVGQYPLIKSTNAITVGTLNLAAVLPHTVAFLSNNVANSSVDLVVTANTQPLRWSTGNGTWNINIAANWKDSAAAVTTYQQVGSLGDTIVLEDSQSGANPVITLDSTVIPAGVTVDASKNYTVSGLGTISGIGSLTKTNSGTLTLTTSNSFTGGLGINGGTLNFAALTNLGGGTITFNGGTLQYASGNVDDISGRTVTLAANGGTIDSAANAIIYANPIGTAASTGGLAKTGSGSLTLNGINRYTGNTLISQGTLALGSPTTFISNSAAIIVTSGTTLDATAGALSLSTPVSQALVGVGTVNGPVTVPNSTRISPATNGVVGTLAIGSGSLTMSGGTLNLDISTNSHDMITVNGNVTLNLGTIQFNATSQLTNGVYRLITYTGALTGGAGSVGNIALTGVSLFAATLNATTPGEINLVIADSAADNITWRGTGSDWDLIGSLNWLLGATPWAFTNGDAVTFDDNGTAVPNVLLQGIVVPASVVVSNTSTQYTFVDGTGSGGGKISGPGGLIKRGAGTLVLNTANNYSGPTTISAGTLQVGDLSSTGDIGTGNVTNNSAILFMQTDARTVSGQVTGTGTLTQFGTTTLTLANNNNYTGATTISLGALQIGTGGAVGTLGTGPVTDDALLIINRSGTFSFTNNVSGNGSVSNIGPATITLTRTNAYLGNTAIARGITKLSAPDMIPDAVSVVGSSGMLILDGSAGFAGVLDLSGFNESINALQGAAGTVLGVISNSVGGATGTNVLRIGSDLGNPNGTYAGLILDNTNSPKIAVVKLGVGVQTLSGANTYSGGTLVGGGQLSVGAGGQAGNTGAGIGSITMSNGTIFFMGGNAITFPANPIIITPNSIVNFNSQVLGNQYSGLVSGDSNSTNAMVGPVTGSGTGQWNAFPGTVLIPLGGELRSAGANNGGSNTTFHVEGFLHTRNNDNFFIGALTGNGNIDNPTVTPPATFLIGSKNVESLYSGNFSGFNHVVKSGTARLTLSGTNVSYTGNTTVSNGTLAFVVPANVSNSPIVSLAGSLAVLDARAMGYTSNELDENLIITNSFFVTNSILALNNAQTLTGIGTVNGNVIASAGSTLRPGLPIGNLTVTSNLTLSGPIVMELNRTNSPATNDMLTAQSFTVSGGSVTVTNLGPDLITGDSFKLFSSPVAGLTYSLPVSNALNTISYVWTNKVSIDGTIVLLSGATGVNLNPTNITVTTTATGVSIGWPSSHIGWRLQVQTNSISVGLSTNWLIVPNSQLTNQVSFSFNPSNVAVFYRLTYP